MEGKHTPEEIELLIKSLQQGVEQCKDDGRMDECSFGYETGVLITGRDGEYLLALLEQVEKLKKELNEIKERYSGNDPSDLQALIIRLFPPEEYGEDSNVEELFNSVTDLESEVEKLKAREKELIVAAEEIVYAYENGYVFNRRIKVIKDLITRIKQTT